MKTRFLYLVKALRAYRAVVSGQFDQESRFVVQETQDAANAIETLERENAELVSVLEMAEDRLWHAAYNDAMRHTENHDRAHKFAQEHSDVIQIRSALESAKSAR